MSYMSEINYQKREISTLILTLPFPTCWFIACKKLLKNKILTFSSDFSQWRISHGVIEFLSATATWLFLKVNWEWMFQFSQIGYYWKWVWDCAFNITKIIFKFVGIMFKLYFINYLNLFSRVILTSNSWKLVHSFSHSKFWKIRTGHSCLTDFT